MRIIDHSESTGTPVAKIWKVGTRNTAEIVTRIIDERRSWKVEDVSITTGGYQEHLFFRVEENSGKFTCTCPANQSKEGCAHVRKVVWGLRRYPVEESTVSKRRIRVTN